MITRLLFGDMSTRGRVGVSIVCLIFFLIVVSSNSPAPKQAATSKSVLAAGVAPTAIVAPTITPVPTEAPAPTATMAALPKVGERAEVASVVLTVNSVERKDELNKYQKAEAGSEFVIVDVLIENTWTEEEPYNPYYFSVKDGTGVESSVEMNMERGALQSGDLIPGDKVKGTVVFKVAKGATGLVMTYEPLVLAGGYRPLRIDLGE